MKIQRLYQVATVALMVAAIASSLAVSAQAQTENTLYTFPGGWVGGLPASSLTSDPAGNLYGATEWGGANPKICDVAFSPCGTIFKLSPGSGGTWTESVIHSFSGDANGGRVFKGVVRDATGNLYGTTPQGGDLTACGGAGCGVVYKLTPTSSGHYQETVLHTFTGGTDGSAPFSNLILDAAGNLYGTTSAGGSPNGCNKAGCGVVFRVSHTSTGWHESVLRALNFAVDGQFPTDLVMDSAGNIYGASSQGPNFVTCSLGCGLVWRLSPTASGPWTESLLYTFAGGDDGANPIGGMILDGAGNLYGTTEEGGNGGSRGTVFELSPTPSGPWTETQLFVFTGGAGGKFPISSLVFDAAGNLYGSTSQGGNETICGNGCGVVFELSPTGFVGRPWTETVLHTFAITDGFNPNGIISDGAGHLFGSANSGGSASLGVVFEVTY